MPITENLMLAGLREYAYVGLVNEDSRVIPATAFEPSVLNRRRLNMWTFICFISKVLIKTEYTLKYGMSNKNRLAAASVSLAAPFFWTFKPSMHLASFPTPKRWRRGWLHLILLIR